MSKKKLSQIVGLTVGTLAIAGTGVASSIALTSCTAPVDLGPVSLDANALSTVFSTISAKIKNTSFVPGTNDQVSPTQTALNATDNVQNLKYAISEALNQNNGINLAPNDIKTISFSLTPKQTPNSALVNQASVSTKVIFADSVGLPESVDNPNLSLDVPAFSVSNDNLVTLTNKSIVSLDKSKSSSINSAVVTVLNSFWADGKGENASVTKLNQTGYVQDAFKAQIVASVNKNTKHTKASQTLLSPANIQSIQFKTQTGENENANTGLNYTINFDNNVDLSKWDTNGSLFQVSGQSISSKQPIALANPSYTVYTVQSGVSQGILSVVQDQLSNVSAADFTLDYLNQDPAFGAELRDAISSVIEVPSNQFKVEFLPFEANANQPMSNLNFKINFGASVIIAGDWSPNFSYSSQNNSNSLTSLNGVQVPNPRFEPVQISVDAIQTISHQIDQTITSYLKSHPHWTLSDLNNPSFVRQLTNVIVTNAHNNDLIPAYIQGILFNQTINTNNPAELNLTYSISFSSYVDLSNLTNCGVYSVVDHQLVSHSLLQFSNPNFKPLIISSSQAETIFHQISNLLIKLNNDNPSSFNSNFLNTATVTNQVIGIINNALDTTLLPIDFKGVYFDVGPRNGTPGNPQNWVITYSMDFGNNIDLSQIGDGPYYRVVNQHTLSTATWMTLDNLSYQPPVYPSIDSQAYKTINNVVRTSLQQLGANQVLDSHALNANINFKNGLIASIVNALKPSIPSMSMDSIHAINFQVSVLDPNTNHFSVTPSIVFDQNVSFQNLDHPNQTLTFSPVDFVPTNPFLTKQAASVINNVIVKQLDQLKNTNPNLINRDYLNNSDFIDNILVNTIKQDTFKNTNIRPSDLSLYFDTTPVENQANVQVSYSIKFNHVGIAQDAVAPEGLVFNADKTSLSTATPLTYPNYVLTGKMVGEVFNTIQGVINTMKENNIGDLTTIYPLRDKKKQTIINTVNEKFKISTQASVIQDIVFMVNKGTGMISATVQFDPKYQIEGTIDTSNNPDQSSFSNICMTGKPNQYQMNFYVPGISYYIVNNDLDILQQVVNKFVDDYMNAITNDNINDYMGIFYNRLAQAGFNLNWLDQDPKYTKFTVDYGNNTMSFSAQFKNWIQDKNIINNNYNHQDHAYYVQCSPRLGIKNILTSNRLAVMDQQIQAGINALYQEYVVNQRRSLGDFNNHLNSDEDGFKITGDIYDQVRQICGFDASQHWMGKINWNVYTDSAGRINAQYSFEMSSSSYVVQSNLDLNGYSFSIVPNKDGPSYHFSKEITLH